MKAWFPKGEDDPEIALIRVTAEKAEYWDAPVEDQTEETANPRILEFLQKLSQPDRASPVQTDLPS